MDSQAEKLYQVAVDLDARVSYFLQGVTAAALAYAVQKAEDISSADPISATLAMATLVLWGLSFVAGCAQLSAMATIVQSNLREIQLQVLAAKTKEQLREVPAAFLKDLADLKKSVERKGKFKKVFSQLQLWSLGLGAIVFVTWRLLPVFEILK